MKKIKWLGVLLVVVTVFALFSVCQGAPKQITLQIIDVAGSKQMVGGAVDAFIAKNPNVKLDYIIGTAPELPAKIKAQQMAGNVETCVVLTGYDALGSGLVQKIWERILPEQKKNLPKLEEIYLPAAKTAYDLFEGYGIPFAWCPGGPMFTYNPDKVKNVPRTAA
ncbi:MAG: extracellular solute-binding protein, partial [Bacteroidota bacterium]